MPLADTRDALDELQRAGAAASSIPATVLRSCSLLFPPSVNCPTVTNTLDELPSTNESIDTPVPSTSGQLPSRKSKTPSSMSTPGSSVASNKNGCINSFLFSQFREQFIESSAQFVANVIGCSALQTHDIKCLSLLHLEEIFTLTSVLSLEDTTILK
jgi:hypothetical protein